MFTNGESSIGININHRFAWYFIRRKTKSQSGLQFLKGIFLFQRSSFTQLDRPLSPSNPIFLVLGQHQFLGSDMVCRKSRQNLTSFRRT